ncbi:MAG TPA: hypothetical protein DCF63_00530, partial [Planctomycetaceae bacterium]|nr:hypothetical protein [Planctomycetaceae bacterium]
MPSLPNTDILKQLAVCDVLLDPFPYGGGNTTLEGLAMNTPVVTLPSNFLSGRITLALLKQLGLESCVADSAEKYVRLAVELALQPNQRQAVSKQIADRCHLLFNQ